MSDTGAGLLQLGLLVATLVVCHRPLGDYMAWVFSSSRHWRVECRLRAHGLITRLPYTHRYHVTTPDSTTPCSSPAPTTGSCAPAWPNSPTQNPDPSKQPAAATRQPSTNSPANPDSQPET
jgi:hypothetical protein